MRVLRVTQPEDVLSRLRPLPTLRDRVRRCETLLAAAHELRATSPAGTDLVLNTAGRKAFGLWGAADQPGKWDHWSVAVVVGGASRPNSNGRLVIDVGDIILGMRRYATTRIDLIIEEGIITRIEGEGLDAHLLRNWFASWGDERAFHISHVGWGCDERSDWGRMAGPTGGIGDAESYPGVFQIAFGRDTSWYIGDGTNDVVAHIDFNGLAHSIALDGVPITENGRFVHPDLVSDAVEVRATPGVVAGRLAVALASFARFQVVQQLLAIHAGDGHRFGVAARGPVIHFFRHARRWWLILSLMGVGRSSKRPNAE